MASLASTQAFKSGRYESVYTVQLQRNLALASNYVQSPVAIPAGFTPTSLQVVGGNNNSDAGTTATLAIGSSGYGGTDFVAAYNVKTASASVAIPSSTLLMGAPLPFDTVLDITYRESGTASTAGGPWTVIVKGLNVG